MKLGIGLKTGNWFEDGKAEVGTILDEVEIVEIDRGSVARLVAAESMISESDWSHKCWTVDGQEAPDNIQEEINSMLTSDPLDVCDVLEAVAAELDDEEFSRLIDKISDCDPVEIADGYDHTYIPRR